jgi:hypothetical protein
MNIRPFVIIFVCAAAPAIAFPLGIRIGSSWGAKSGPGPIETQDSRRVVAPPQSVRVIMSNTLDGQPIPGGKNEAPESPRTLSPVYPTSASPETAISASQGLVPAPRQDEAEVAAAPKLEADANDPQRASSGVQNESPKAEEPRIRHRRRDRVTAFARHVGRPYLWHGRHYRHFAYRRSGPSNPFAAIAGLFFR